ncbi:HNH endonuclease family protein [Microbispora sp. H11081]|uniref:HNH endonuclease family protein n=1 Tax=Microbispora sp. H11081 TaxID=2729107 RepID=UPI002015FE26|nr:HNH endonuclease family protein [Microbispora sp. H11081]
MIAGISVAVAVLAGCGPMPELDDALTGQSGGSGGGGGGGGGKSESGPDRGVNPLDNPDGTGPGLKAITSDKDRAEARELIDQVKTKGRGSKTGYDRDKFGYAWADNVDDVPWGRNGCDTRNDLLKRDGGDIKYRDGSNCVIVSMTIYDPYTGKTIDWTKSEAAEVQIDHVMPLSYDWQMGASRWSESKRKRIANDPLNLIPVDGSTNGSKGDSGPATWLPPRTEIRCSYAVRFAQVALKYNLPVTSADKAAMLEQCK